MSTYHKQHGKLLSAHASFPIRIRNSKIIRHSQVTTHRPLLQFQGKRDQRCSEMRGNRRLAVGDWRPAHRMDVDSERGRLIDERWKGQKNKTQQSEMKQSGK